MTLTDEPPGQKVSPIHTGFLKERDMWNPMKETKYLWNPNKYILNSEGYKLQALCRQQNSVTRRKLNKQMILVQRFGL